MKTTKRIILLSMLACALLFFGQCKKADDNIISKSTIINIEQPDSIAVCGIKIAYVDYDSLLANYNFAQEIHKEIIRREMILSDILESEGNNLQEEAAAFEKKVQNNEFPTQEEAQAEYEKIMQKNQELMKRRQTMIAELDEHRNAKYNEMAQSIDDYIQEYNSVAMYDFILTKVGSNMLYTNKAWDITKQIVEGLNAKYNADK